MIREAFVNKSILITGATGFVGKVLLEKFIAAIPNFRRIFVIIRPKRGVKPMDRVRNEIFSSECFATVKKTIPNFDQFISEKIVPIEGDICKDGLALKAADRERLVNELDIIINCAASVNFTERLCDALQINYYGALRMMELAKECKHLEVFTHMSTCYVNCDKRGFLNEKIYPIE